MVSHGQKSRNGIAVPSRVGEIHETRLGLPGDPDPAQSRYFEAAVNGMLIAGPYLPSGNPRPGPKFDTSSPGSAGSSRMPLSSSTRAPVMFARDFNVMPTERDVGEPERWLDDALFAPEVRAAFFRLIDQGSTDSRRNIHPDETIYTLCDYFRNAYRRDAGLRIDHLFLSASIADRLVDAQVDRHVRGWEKTSDHPPTWFERGDTKPAFGKRN